MLKFTKFEGLDNLWKLKFLLVPHIAVSIILSFVNVPLSLSVKSKFCHHMSLQHNTCYTPKSFYSPFPSLTKNGLYTKSQIFIYYLGMVYKLYNECTTCAVFGLSAPDVLNRD